MQLLTEIEANLVEHVGQGGEIAQMLVTLEEHQERQVLGRSSGMGGDKVQIPPDLVIIYQTIDLVGII
jgi:hypothetical protein